MKKRTIWRIIGVVLFIGLSNVTPLYFFYRIVFDGVLDPSELDYITKDKVYVYGGGWLKDSLHDPYYKRYALMYPHADRTLYRVRPIELWRFWRWRDYLTEERWRQPYLNVDEDQVWRTFRTFGATYTPYEGPLPPHTHKDSVSARHSFNRFMPKDTTARL